MSKKNLLVSVIVPVFNGERFLSQALDSICMQPCQDLEIIVVDDGSRDGSAEIVRAYEDKIVYHYQENSGPAGARNAGLAVAQGEFIAFLDADDLWPIDRLTQTLEILQTEPTVDVVIGRSQFLKVCTAGKQPDEFNEVLSPRVYLQLGSAVFRRSAFDRVGLFNPELKFCEDIDWFLRACEHGIFIKTVEMITLLYRLHEHNMTRGATRNELQIARVLKRSLDRRRGRVERDPSTVKPLEYLLGGGKRSQE